MSTANRFSSLFKSPTNASTTKYTTDFPELGKETTNDTTKESTKESTDFPELGKETTKELKKTPTKIILGHRSYEEELRQQNKHYDEEEIMSQKSAYDILADKEKLATSLTKTRMCKSVDANEPCQHGDECRFAHSLDELKISDCLFEQRCRFVRMSNGELINVDRTKNICSHKHPHENIETFMRRTGFDRYKHVSTKVVVLPAPPFSPSQPPPPTSPTSSHFQLVNVEQPNVEKLEVEQHKVEKLEVEQLKVEQHTGVSKTQVLDNSDQILVIRVPKQLATQALEIAIKSGKSNVQIVVVD